MGKTYNLPAVICLNPAIGDVVAVRTRPGAKAPIIRFRPHPGVAGEPVVGENRGLRVVIAAGQADLAGLTAGQFTEIDRLW